MLCPRRPHDPNGVFNLPGEDSFRGDDTCSYCGSLNPDTLMAHLESGDVSLGPTDKDYKVYVQAKPNKEDKQLATGERGYNKFYFIHLSTDQKKRFVELLNERKIDFGGSAGFYVTPYFISRGS